MFLEILAILVVEPGRTMLAERQGKAGARGRRTLFTNLLLTTDGETGDGV